MPNYSFLKKSKKSAKGKSKIKAGFIVAGVLGVLLVLATAVPAFLAYRDAVALKAAFKDFKDGIILQDLTHMERALGAADTELKRMQLHTAPLNWTRVVPFVGGYKADMDRVFRASRNAIDAGDLLIESIRPNADLLGFASDGAPAAELSGQERIQGVIELMPQLAKDIDPVAAKVVEINADMARINSARYPKDIGSISIRDSLDQIMSLSDSLARAAPRFKEILNTLPNELGLKKPKTYLVIFQNDKELRSTGGFWTAYAIVTLDKGAITNMVSGDMYFLDIDNRASYYPPAPYPIATFLKLDDWYIRDVNIYPDFKESVDTMGEFWNRIPGLPGYDAVVGIDTFVVEDLLAVLGPVELGGYGEFNSENVTYQLEMVSNVLKKNEGDRKDILGGLMREIVSRAFSLPSNEYDKLLGAVFDNLSRKHILLYFENPKAQELAEEFNYAGRIDTSWEGDYLHINDTNLAGRKGNWWMEEQVNKVTDKGGKTTLTVVYKNTGDYHPEWNTGYRDWVRVYVPKGSTLLNTSGSLYEVTTGEEYGKTYFAGYMAVDPKQSVTLTLEYQIPVSADLKNLLIQKQPGTPGFVYTIQWDGKSKEVSLDKDARVSF